VSYTGDADSNHPDESIWRTLEQLQKRWQKRFRHLLTRHNLFNSRRIMRTVTSNENFRAIRVLKKRDAPNRMANRPIMQYL